MEEQQHQRRKKIPKRPKNSNGGGGKIPKTRFISLTGGNPNNRNRKLIIRKKIAKAVFFENSEPIETQIYLDTDNIKIAEDFYSALLNFLEKFDFRITKEDPPKIGSWYKRLWGKFVKALTHKEVTSRVDQIERALQLKHVDKVQSEVDLNYAEAVARLNESTQNIPNYAILLGSLLYAKSTYNSEVRIFVQVLTQEQIKIVKQNQNLLTKPFELINRMEEAEVKILTEGTKKLKEGK